MTITRRAQVRLALLATCAGAAIVAACGGGDDSSAPKDAGTTPRSDAAPVIPVDSGHAAMVDGGTLVDAAPADAATGDSGLAALSCTGYLYCEDFESYEDAGAIASGAKLGPWTTNVGGKTDAGQTLAMGVDSVNPYSGLRALHLTAPAGEGTDGMLQRATADGGDIGGNMYGRAMIFYSGAPLPGGSAPLTDSGTYGLPVGPPGQGNHVWIFQGYGPSPQLKDQVSVNILVGTPYLAINYQPGPSAGYGESGRSGATDAGPVTLGAWHCLQWQYDGSGATPNNVIKVWLDGNLDVEVDPSFEDAAVKLASDWTSMALGFTHYQLMANAVDVYLDDFALNNQMVPCPAP